MRGRSEAGDGLDAQMRPNDDRARELEALRRRAYGPDADIFGDAAAVARLAELEEDVRLDRVALLASVTEDSGRVSTSAAAVAGSDGMATAGRPHGSGTSASSPPADEPESAGEATGVSAHRRAPRWHSALVTVTAAAAVLLAIVAGDTTGAVVDDAASDSASDSADLNSERDAAYRASYRLYLDGLRDEALALPGGEEVAARMIRDSLRPYGVLYGRTVAVGPTTDHKYCMIIADLPEASVSCIPVDRADARSVSVELPAWYSDADSDLFTGLGEAVAYTLMPGGTVIAEPAATADSLDDAGVPVLDNPAPAPTAVPPPGWQ